MAHIFFEQLENRRSTQSLYAGYTISDQKSLPDYGVFYPYPEESTPIYNPISPVNYFPRDSVYNPIGFSNPYSSIWNDPLGSYSTPWINPLNVFGGIGNFIFPFWNNFRTVFRWKPTPLPPEYPDPEPIFRPMYGIIDPISTIVEPDPEPIFRPMYGITNPISTIFTSYSPPSSRAVFLYGINPPNEPSTSYAITGFNALYL